MEFVPRSMSLTEELVLKRSKASSLDAVKNLNCWGCGLHDVSILAKLPNLEVLNIRYLHVCELVPCTVYMYTQLHVHKVY